jgi:inorganic pyrophosphatase
MIYSDKDEPEFWFFLEKLINESHITIDRPKGSHHPNYPEIIYPLDYGYLAETTSNDGNEIDVWGGSAKTHELTAIILTVDLYKRDTEVKLLLGCSEDEIQTILKFHNQNGMRAIIVQRNTKVERE